MTKAPTCSLSWCRMKTTDPSGRCHHHRRSNPAVAPALTPPPSPKNEAPKLEVIRDSSGMPMKTQWTVDGVPHREDGPAVIEHVQGGRLYKEIYYRRGYLHRDDGPAEVTYHSDGKTIGIEDYYDHGAKHRIGGPAEVIYNPDGSVLAETHYIDDTRHRFGGPAVVGYRADGSAESENFFLRGTEYDPKDFGATFGRLPEFVRREVIETSELVPLFEELGYDEAIAAIEKALSQGVYTLAGIREVAAGAPAEWVRSWERAS